MNDVPRTTKPTALCAVCGKPGDPSTEHVIAKQIRKVLHRQQHAPATTGTLQKFPRAFSD